ncbi:Dyp-type peroxidase [Brachybacterium hainanense]|uniref:Dyp-type peroxidase n=1 Tax=Brachybacterium hainanense TaxID=1541174 RepID=A0ABV6R6U1_9MICO
MSTHSTPVPQAIDAPLTRAATFLVLVLEDGPGPLAAVREALGGMEDLLKTVGFRSPGGRLSCTVGIGARVWTALTGRRLPRELHPFREIAGARHTAPATPGDVLLHIRADRADLCYEVERLLLAQLDGQVTTADETTGFRYFDARDLLGFVDGTANPIGPDLPEATLVGEEDPEFAGGSYVVVQKYTHPLAAWEALNTQQQEQILGRRKFDNVELPDAETGQKSHKTLATIEDADGEHDILRDNMPFARPAAGEYGTYFIGFTRRLWVLERMLERMFIGDPPGLHDRLLDFSTARTGSTFFAPSAELLASLGDEPEPDSSLLSRRAAPPPPRPSARSGTGGTAG